MTPQLNDSPYEESGSYTEQQLRDLESALDYEYADDVQPRSTHPRIEQVIYYD